MNEDRCVRCHRDFSNQSRPRWAFNRRSGKLLGRAHASPQAGCVTDPEVVTFHGSRTEARLTFFLWNVEERPPSYAAASWARYLIGRNAEDQAQSLDWWRTGPAQLDGTMLYAIRDELAKLETRFAAWRPEEA